MPDVSAIYFVEPKQDNIDRIAKVGRGRGTAAPLGGTVPHARPAHCPGWYTWPPWALQDLAANLYESYYINFLAPVPGALLNQLAAASVQADVVDRVAKVMPHPKGRSVWAQPTLMCPGARATAVHSDTRQVYDQYLNFISLEPRLFSLRQPEAFVTLNSVSSVESEVTQTTEAIASGLLSVLVTLGEHAGLAGSPRAAPAGTVRSDGAPARPVPWRAQGSPPGDVPIIRAPRGNAAGMVAEKLEQSLRNHLSNSRGNLFPDTAGVIGYQRPGAPSARSCPRKTHARGRVLVGPNLDDRRSPPQMGTLAPGHASAHSS